MELGSSLAALGVDQLRIEGHTDLKGSSGYNLQLSQRRAEAVAQVLRERAVPRAVHGAQPRQGAAGVHRRHRGLPVAEPAGGADRPGALTGPIRPRAQRLSSARIASITPL
jgi:hypothetical protein